MSELSILRVPIDGEWWAFEMAGFVKAVDELYADVVLISVARELRDLASRYPQEALLFHSRADRLQAIILSSVPASSHFLQSDRFEIEMSRKVHLVAPLQVVSIKYGSEGGFDFLGLGRFADAVASVYNKTLDYIGGKSGREGEALDNIQKKLEIARLAGMSDEEVKIYGQELLAKHDKAFRKLAETKRLPKPMQLLPAPADFAQRKPPKYQ